MSLGLLKFTAVRHVSQPYLEDTVSPECHHTPHHPNVMMILYTRATSAALAFYATVQPVTLADK